MGQKISELTDGITAQGSDLVRVARQSGGGYIDRRLSLGDLSALLTNVTITGGDSLRFSDFEDGVNTVGTGTPRTLSSLGYSDGSSATQFPLTASAWGGITASAVDYDTAVIQEAFLTIAGAGNKNRYLVAGAGDFILSGHEVILPSYKGTGTSGYPNQFVFDGQGCIFFLRGSQTYGFTSDIADQTEASAQSIFNTWALSNFKVVQGSGGTVSVGMRLGACRSLDMRNVEFEGLDDYGFVGGFLLNALFTNVNTNFCGQDGILIDKGWWSGAGYSIAGNQVMFINCRLRTTSTTQVGARIIGTDSCEFYRCTLEGSDGAYGIYIDNSVTTVAKNVVINGVHAEIGDGNKYTNAIIGMKGSDPFTCEVRRVFWQSSDTNVILLESESTNGTNHIVIRDCLTNQTWKLKQINTTGGTSSWDMKNVTLQGNPTDAADVRDTVGFPNIWATATVPTSNRVRFEPPMN
jgi:hypothetical protein